MAASHLRPDHRGHLEGVRQMDRLSLQPASNSAIVRKSKGHNMGNTLKDLLNGTFDTRDEHTATLTASDATLAAIAMIRKMAADEKKRKAGTNGK